MGELPDHQKFEMWKQDQASLNNQDFGPFGFLITGAIKLVILGIIWPVLKGLFWNLPRLFFRK